MDNTQTIGTKKEPEGRLHSSESEGDLVDALANPTQDQRQQLHQRHRTIGMEGFAFSTLCKSAL